MTTTSASIPTDSRVLPARDSSTRSRSPRWALASLSLTVLLASLGSSVANVALPTFVTTFAASFHHVQWVVMIYLLAITTMIVGAGRLGDVIGRRRLLLWGLAVFMGASILGGLAPALGVVIAARAAQGLGAAAMMALAMPLVSGIVPRERTGSAIGLLGTVSAIGTALGPSLGGWLIAMHGWRSIFFLNLPLGAAAWILAHRHLDEDRNEATGRAQFDGIGTFLMAGCLASYCLAMTAGGGEPTLVNGALLGSAIGCAVLFVRSQTRGTSPLIRIEILRDRETAISLLTNTLVTTVVMATLVVGPFYLSHSLELDPAGVGLVMSVGPVVAALAGAPAGRLVDRFGTRGIAAIGLVGMVSGSGLISASRPTAGVGGYVVPLALLTAGYALFQAANNTALMRDLRQSERGIVSGLLNLSRNLGLITGASVMGGIFAAASGMSSMKTATPEAIAGAMRITFLAGTVMTLFALIIAGVRARTTTLNDECRTC